MSHNRRGCAMNARLSFLAIAIVSTMTLVAATIRAQDGATMDPATSDPALVEATATTAQTVEPADVLKMMHDKDAQYAIVDTQPVQGYAEGHIPGAISYPWAMQIKTFPIPLPRDRLLIFYGSCPNDTSDTVKKLAEFGYFNVKIMNGGWYKWLELKYPTADSDSNSSPDLSHLNGPREGTISR